MTESVMRHAMLVDEMVRRYGGPAIDERKPWDTSARQRKWLREKIEAALSPDARANPHPETGIAFATEPPRDPHTPY